MNRAALALVLIGTSGCATAPAPRTYDLGIEVPQARLQALRPVTVRASAPLDGVEMHYRLAWRNASEVAAYTQSRWAAPPAELLRKQLLRASVEGPAKCALEIELQEFSQVFASAQASEARIELQASLAGPKGRIGARSWHITEPNGGADAAGGAAALARAADAAVGEIAGWVAATPDCR